MSDPPVRITRRPDRSYPARWECTMPGCNAASVSTSRKAAAAAHSLHMDREHAEEEA
ncbi:hypothetical protein [Nocardiopsis dassonvillei]|uniref:hypothetical protein n=1 Tax=Nocardiopsis dassonvillei TaxID=2014 RepID=UPI00157CE42C|nr:hypothetical protein [Nocardiopsis dassonvillei]